MTINKIAQAVFDSFQDSEIIIAIVDRNGSYVSNKIHLFEQIFSKQELLEQLCQKIDDGCEPLMDQVGDYLVAASGFSANGSWGGYTVMLIPNCNLHKAVGCTDFLEIILSQVSIVAEKVALQSQGPCYQFSPEQMAEAAMN